MTPQQLKAMKLALEALEYWDVHGKLHQPTEEAITAIEEVLAEHAMSEVQRLGQEIEQGPCVHAKNPKGCYRVRCQLGDKCVDDEMSFRTTPPQRKPLTDEEIDAIADEYLVDYRIPAGCALNFARDIEAAHGIKENT